MNEQNNDLKSEVQDLSSIEIKPSENRSDEPCESGDSPMPHEEQRRYWERDLSYKRLSFIISIGGFILITGSVFVNSYQIYINTRQLDLNTAQSKRLEKSIRANVQNSTLNHVTSLDQVFIQKPYLRPYFYEGKSLDDKDEKYQEVSATAVMVLDVFDLVATQSKTFPEFWDSPEAWDEWIIDIFSTSPILRDTFDKYSTWYGKGLMELRKRVQERLEEKATQKVKSQGG